MRYRWHYDTGSEYLNNFLAIEQEVDSNSVQDVLVDAAEDITVHLMEEGARDIETEGTDIEYNEVAFVWTDGVRYIGSITVHDDDTNKQLT